MRPEEGQSFIVLTTVGPGTAQPGFVARFRRTVSFLLP